MSVGENGGVRYSINPCPVRHVRRSKKRQADAGPASRERSFQRMPGIMPFMPRISFCRLPPLSFFIMVRICSYWLSMRFTS